MQSYGLTEETERDLREVARHTLNRWGGEKRYSNNTAMA
jgi:plasmid stabilization system protein ParE